MPVPQSINEPGTYAFESMTPGSINEPPLFPPGQTYPSITSIAPTTKAIGSGDFTLTVTGTGFSGPSSVFFNGRKIVPSTYNAGTLSVLIKTVTFTTPQTVQVQVRNGTLPSNLKPFVFT